MPFMTHPDHGATNVSDAAIEDHVKNGWAITARSDWMARKVRPAAVVFEPEPELADAPKPKRGRPAKG
jgi:hypothetical protein